MFYMYSLGLIFVLGLAQAVDIAHLDHPYINWFTEREVHYKRIAEFLSRENRPYVSCSGTNDDERKDLMNDEELWKLWDKSEDVYIVRFREVFVADKPSDLDSTVPETSRMKLFNTTGEILFTLKTEGVAQSFTPSELNMIVANNRNRTKKDMMRFRAGSFYLPKDKAVISANNLNFLTPVFCMASIAMRHEYIIFARRELGINDHHSSIYTDLALTYEPIKVMKSYQNAFFSKLCPTCQKPEAEISGELEVIEGQNANVKCTAKSELEPWIRFEHRRRKFDVIERQRISFDEQKPHEMELNLMPAFGPDEGVWICVVSNLVGVTRVNFTIQVNDQIIESDELANWLPCNTDLYCYNDATGCFINEKDENDFQCKCRPPFYGNDCSMRKVELPPETRLNIEDILNGAVDRMIKHTTWIIVASFVVMTALVLIALSIGWMYRMQKYGKKKRRNGKPEHRMLVVEHNHEQVA